MGLPYRARVNEHVRLNLPGFRNGGAYVFTYVEDTSDRGLAHSDGCGDPECTECGGPYNFEPRILLELEDDGSDYMEFFFDVDSKGGRANSLHKLDTLIVALRVFRQGLVDEFDQYDLRQRELDALRE